MRVHIFTADPQDLSQEAEWMANELEAIGQETIDKLVKTALRQRDLAYAPYSNYQVGAAILATSGVIYGGNNIERVSYSESIHAEESAIARAILDGEVEDSGRRFLKALVVSHEGDSAPCGHCRQIMAEHADNCLVILVNPAGEVHTVTSLKTLLPLAFTPSSLGIE